MEIVTNKDEEQRLKNLLNSRTDSEARRMERFLAMPDLTRTEGPIKELIKRITGLPEFSAFDTIEVPEINSTAITFDLFNFKPDHPARSKSDTYFVDDNNILRPHSTVMWYYYLNLPEVKSELKTMRTLVFFVTVRFIAKMRLIALIWTSSTKLTLFI